MSVDPPVWCRWEPLADEGYPTPTQHYSPMNHDFWHSKWENKEIAFHEGRPNSLLMKHFSRLGLGSGDRVFVPLCGKTRDIAWLLSEGYGVVGAELNESAVKELFHELEVEPEVHELEKLKRYAGPDLDVFVGDIFELSSAQVGSVQAVYDRAALVALPEELRKRYTAHVMEITSEASQLLIHFPYDQSLMDGPPFSVTADEVVRHYGEHFEVTLLESREIEGGLKGQVEALEMIHLLRSRRTEGTGTAPT